MAFAERYACILYFLAAAHPATGMDACASRCREQTCGSLRFALSCAETEELGCNCGGCCGDACGVWCRDAPCATMAQSFTCGELTDILGCHCGTCCNASFPSPPPSPALPGATFGSRDCVELPDFGPPLGIVMGVFGSVGINVGQNLQADGIATLPVELREKAPHKSSKWKVGMAIFVSFSMLNFAALAFAPASVLVPLESIQFVTNVFYSYLVHQKRVPRRMMAGVAFACLGTVLTVVFGAAGGGCHSIPLLERAWHTTGWWVFVLLSMVGAVIALRVSSVYDRRIANGESPPYAEYVRPICFTLSSALLGGAPMIVQSKVFSEALGMLFQGDLEVFISWILYVSLLLCILCGIIWVVRLTACLGMYDPLLILPLMVATYIVFGGIAGGIYFDEFGTLHEGPGGAGRWALYILGMGCVLSGLYCIATAGVAAEAEERQSQLQNPTSLRGTVTTDERHSSLLHSPALLPSGVHPGVTFVKSVRSSDYMLEVSRKLKYVQDLSSSKLDDLRSKSFHPSSSSGLARRDAQAAGDNSGVGDGASNAREGGFTASPMQRNSSVYPSEYAPSDLESENDDGAGGGRGGPPPVQHVSSI